MDETFDGGDRFTSFIGDGNELVEGIACRGPAAPNEEQESIIAAIMEELKETYPGDRYVMSRKSYIMFDAYNVVAPELVVMEKDEESGDVTWGLPVLVLETEYSAVKVNLYRLFGVEHYWAFGQEGCELVKHHFG